MLTKLLTSGLSLLISFILIVFGFVVWLDLTQVLFGPLDEIIYTVLISFMSWCMVRIRRLGKEGKL